MKFLIDNSCPPAEHLELVAGQLLTPLTFYKNWSKRCFAIDNGAFTKFDARAFSALLEREKENSNGCLFVCSPDVVGNAKRTLEIWQHRDNYIPHCYPPALVAQDGIEDMEIPWMEFKTIFIGGTDKFKDSSSVIDICKTAKILGRQVHVGRVNTSKRYEHFKTFADTCDGSGVSRGLDSGRHLRQIYQGTKQQKLNLIEA